MKMDEGYFKNKRALICTAWKLGNFTEADSFLRQIAHDQREACHEALNKAVNYEYDCPQRYEMTLWQAWEAVRNAEIEGERG